jgi:hypothetical protein
MGPPIDGAARLPAPYPGAVTDSEPQPTPPRRNRKPQMMKPQTAADKLGVYLPATPEGFRAGMVSRDDLDAMLQDAPPWLTDLRRNGPHPRQVVAARLRVSASGLARAEHAEPMTTAEIEALIADPPQWLIRERQTFAEVRREEKRLRERDAQQD